jgi:hypothetical protein
MKFIALILLSLQIFATKLPAQAYRCEALNEHEICIVSLQRDSKRYWNYQVAISIDGEKQPVEIYNCRSQFKIQTNGKIVPFADNSPGQFICRNFQG